MEPSSVKRRVVVIGGGLAGIAAAWTLARADVEVELLEAGDTLGGLAGTVEENDAFYPLAYHHILHRDQALLWFLDQLSLLERVRWRKIRMLFHLDGKLWNLADPIDFLRFPMRFTDKLRFARLMLRTFGKSDWSDWNDRSATELVDSWGGPGVREVIFERLSQLKFRMRCDEISGAWLGARLHFREGSSSLGFIPQTNWTRELCLGLEQLLKSVHVRARTGRRVARIETPGDGKSVRVHTLDGAIFEADRCVAAIPTDVYRNLVEPDETDGLFSIDYTAILSGLCTTTQKIDPDFYWMNLAELRQSCNGIFRLESLNHSIGRPGESCLNFVTHVPSRNDALFQRSDEEIWQGFFDDFRSVFGYDVTPRWKKLVRLPLYSPVFHRGYRNPPVRSTSWPQVYFAGNFRNFPTIASTGTALASGVEAAEAMLQDWGQPSAEISSAISRFRLPSRPAADD